MTSWQYIYQRWLCWLDRHRRCALCWKRLTRGTDSTKYIGRARVHDQCYRDASREALEEIRDVTTNGGKPC